MAEGYSCGVCDTRIETAKILVQSNIRSKKAMSFEELTITNIPGVLPCHKCIAIVVNLMTNEKLIPTGNVVGWRNNG